MTPQSLMDTYIQFHCSRWDITLLKRLVLAVIFTAVSTVCLLPQTAQADFRDDIGYTLLSGEVGVSLPAGGGIIVTMSEAKVDDKWMPDITDGECSGKSLNDKSGATAGEYSSHATTVARLFFGNDTSMTPGILTADVYLGDDWLCLGYLNYGVTCMGNPIQPCYVFPSVPASPSRVANHSWVSVNGTGRSNILRLLDFVVAADEFVQAVGISGSLTPVLNASFNAVAVGRTAGNAIGGTPGIDEVYTSGRTCPHLVAPCSCSSAATPVVASAAALLIDLGHGSPSLSNDQFASSTTDRSGRTIYNAERSETIKAALMAGADRVTHNASDNITDYRALEADRALNNLDIRFGAGQVNIYHAYRIISGGEQNSAEDYPIGQGAIGWYGFDFDPCFGGSNSSNTEASYRFTADAGHRMLYAALVWNISIDGGSLLNYDSTAHLFDLDLFLYDVTEPENPLLISSSQSAIDNTEHLWVSLVEGHDYLVKVTRGTTQNSFTWDFALSWRISTPPDTDLDSIPDDWEVQHGLDFNDPGDAQGDLDGDFLSNALEYQKGTDPLNPDTDGDGYDDRIEVLNLTNPLDPQSFPPENPFDVPAVRSGSLAFLMILLIGIGAGSSRNLTAN